MENKAKVIENEELNQRRRERNEIGAVWSRTSRTGSPFMTIKVKIGENDIDNILDAIEDTGKAELFLVAFPCDGGKENDRKPTYRIFKDMRD